MMVFKNKSGLRRSRFGFSLAELLLVIAIITVIATSAIGILRHAQEEARVAATQALILKLDNLLDQRKSHYAIRRVPVDLTQYSDDARTILTLRQMIIMDVVNVEMPRDETNVASFTVLGEYPSPDFRNAVTVLEGSGVLDFNQDTSGNLISELDSNFNRPALSSRFQKPPAVNNLNLNGEYFYGIIATSDMNEGSGLELLGNSAFADTDGDGLFEIIDAWGDPLVFEILNPDGTPLDMTNPADVHDLTFRVSSSNIQ